MSSGKVSSPWRFASPYYVLNSLVVLSYPLLRAHFLAASSHDHGQLQSPAELAKWEQQGITGLCVIFFWKLLRSRSPDHITGLVLFYSRVVVLLMAFLMDRRLFVWYLLAVGLVALVWPQPRARPASSVQLLVPAWFKETVQGTAGGDGGTGVWLVMFTTQWSKECTHFAPAFNELASRYAVPKRLQFGVMDVGTWPLLAKELGISVEIWSNQLPSILLFENGKELGRLPGKATRDDPTLKQYFLKADVIKGFSLDDHYARAAGGTAPPAAAKGRKGGR